MIGHKRAREDVTFIFVTALSKSQFRVNYSNHTFQTAVPQLHRLIICRLRHVGPAVVPQFEEDTRMILHAADAVQEGHRKIVLRTVDTDVLVLAIALAGRFQENKLNSGLRWELALICVTLQCTRYHTAWDQRCPSPYQCSTHSLDAIRCLASLEEARRPLLRYGRATRPS